MSARFTHVGVARDLAAQVRLPALAELALRAAHLLTLWSHRAATRRALAQMENWQLRDIGLSDVAALREARKPFWRP